MNRAWNRVNRALVWELNNRKCSLNHTETLVFVEYVRIICYDLKLLSDNNIMT